MQEAPAAGAAPRLKAKAKAKANKAAAAGKKREKTRYERYCDVEPFWTAAAPELRRELLRVPLRALLETSRSPAGPAAAGGAPAVPAEPLAELVEGLVLLREQGSRSARYWGCPTCDARFGSAKEFLSHVAMFHEELAIQVTLISSCWLWLLAMGRVGILPFDNWYSGPRSTAREPFGGHCALLLALTLTPQSPNPCHLPAGRKVRALHPLHVRHRRYVLYQHQRAGADPVPGLLLQGRQRRQQRCRHLRKGVPALARRVARLVRHLGLHQHAR